MKRPLRVKYRSVAKAKHKSDVRRGELAAALREIADLPDVRADEASAIATRALRSKPPISSEETS